MLIHIDNGDVNMSAFGAAPDYGETDDFVGFSKRGGGLSESRRRWTKGDFPRCESREFAGQADGGDH